jgi:hypothetical protein
MERVYDLNNYLNLVINELLKNQNLCKLLYYTNTEPLTKDDISDTKVLIKNNIINKPFLTKVTKDERSILVVYFDSISSNGTQHQNGIITFDVLCHENLWDVKGGERPYCIFEELKTSLHDKFVSGVGNMYFYTMRSVAANEEFRGYRINFNISDFIR